ncbi:glycosyltransferase, partial [Streptococcus anginosus]|nr:glycosyltransferase [Streptococcus anginosus]
MVPIYQKLKEEDYDCVVTRRQDRQGESWFRSQCARLFYWLINQLSHTPIRSGERDYRMMTR